MTCYLSKEEFALRNPAGLLQMLQRTERTFMLASGPAARLIKTTAIIVQLLIVIIKMPQLLSGAAAYQAMQKISLIHLCHHGLAFFVCGAVQTRNGIAGSP
ncbi:MAG: hypothetical protein JWR61_1391 [Ferruginibacter sp.]|nr:hypothetical protein [Ferruginibacter sp.]